MKAISISRQGFTAIFEAAMKDTEYLYGNGGISKVSPMLIVREFWESDVTEGVFTDEQKAYDYIMNSGPRSMMLLSNTGSIYADIIGGDE